MSTYTRRALEIRTSYHIMSMFLLRRIKENFIVYIAKFGGQSEKKKMKIRNANALNVVMVRWIAVFRRRIFAYSIRFANSFNFMLIGFRICTLPCHRAKTD